ncbi:NUDIX hydrolase [Duncaniella muricolitica]|jgi:ADP-ribose pyrophosphatase YjhB (NUDIX family)|uniref:NUDIX hydrolase n=1 Tax=Duncaniella muricolitica TaxID=2880704 RepID=UPI00244DB19F|nr:NUDIX domain-containing protein [Duncaniella muricolitica]
MAPLANNHISIDCVVLGFDGTNLRVLLVKRRGEDQAGEYNDMKLPGSLIYQDEDLDEAAMRVLHELTGVKDVPLQQFKAFGSRNRTSNQRDVVWLERAQQAHVERIVTIAYFALVKLDGPMQKIVDRESAVWMPVGEVGTLAFDHNLIIEEALKAVRREVENNRSILFDLLPKKFTASQLRLLTEIIYGRSLDVRNFHKKISQMPYVIPLEERQKGVAHRAARYFKFDRKIYNISR